MQYITVGGRQYLKYWHSDDPIMPKGAEVVMDERDIQIQGLYEALKAAAYYVDRLEKAYLGQKIRDMAEASSHYQHTALPLIEAYEKAAP